MRPVLESVLSCFRQHQPRRHDHEEHTPLCAPLCPM
jgi:hypothetical protein